MNGQTQDGWSSYAPPPLLIASGGSRLESATPGGYRFQLSISPLLTGFRLMIMDWADESSVVSDHATLDAAKRHAAESLKVSALSWEAWNLPCGDL